MDTMLEVVFESEGKADGASRTVSPDAEGGISLYAMAVLARHAGGKASVKVTPVVDTRSVPAGGGRTSR